ncbi:hypothetical protein [Flavobacterium piscis]|uniref:Uncharacterized protein n=1 Tax=Flavobacterium piscis TaxID=1114874 RepID=A0ABU1Y2G5_9FLAO|nr:hypothetical protein [Flavobacterium piscis]MDR7208407.1 hypothetical protein [Flavobacterium piscis]
MKNNILKEEYFKLIDHYYDVLLYTESPQAEQLDLIIELVKSKSISLYSLSKSENLHWNFCSFRTYSNTYIDRLNKYLDVNDDTGKNEEDFAKDELRFLHFLLNSEYTMFIDDSISQKVKEQTDKKIQFLTSKISTEKITPKKKAIDIFTSNEAEELFNHYVKETENTPHILAEMSFIYRRMYKDGYINEYVRPEMFKKEINKPPFNIFIEHPLKSLEKVDQISRSNIYKNLKTQTVNKI